jgi:hypothetical protein
MLHSRHLTISRACARWVLVATMGSVFPGRAPSNCWVAASQNMLPSKSGCMPSLSPWWLHAWPLRCSLVCTCLLGCFYHVEAHMRRGCAETLAGVSRCLPIHTASALHTVPACALHRCPYGWPFVLASVLRWGGCLVCGCMFARLSALQGDAACFCCCWDALLLMGCVTVAGMRCCACMRRHSCGSVRLVLPAPGQVTCTRC